MLQKVGHAAQGEGNCRAGGTRCCSERKLQAVQRFLPGYDIIASQLDFSVWKRMKNLAGNLQPLIYGAFPVWRNCTVRAHICNLGASEWRKRKTVSSMLGHFDAGFTLRTYTHVTRQMQESAAEKMGNFMAQVM